MARYRLLKNAPIREAIIDLKVSPIADVSLLEPMFQLLKSKFPKQDVIQQSTFGFQIGPNVQHSSRVDGGKSRVLVRLMHSMQ